MTMITISGNLFDIYHLKDRMILWIKEKDGNAKRMEYVWSPSIYVASDTKDELTSLIRNEKILYFVKEYEFVNRFESPSDMDKTQVLKLTANDSSQIVTLAKSIEKLCKRFGHYRLYNIDISPEQSFLYEKDLYPLGLYDIKEKIAGPNDFNLELIEQDNDNIDSFDYSIPNFTFISFEIISERKTIVTNINDIILAIRVIVFDNDNNIKEKFVILEDTELETILEFSYEIKRLDPDIILTSGGDQFLFPHLFYRAKINKIEPQLLVNLNRELTQEFIRRKNKHLLEINLFSPNSNSSSSFFSYGRVYFRPRPFFLYGRIHIDYDNSFIYKDNGLDGLSEISRVCRMPLQTCIKIYNRKMP